MRSDRVSKRKYRGERWWRELVSKQAAGGESVREVCERHGIKCGPFYRWRRKIQGESAPKFSEMALSLVNECEIRCRNGRAIVVRGAVSRAVLVSVIEAAEECGR